MLRIGGRWASEDMARLWGADAARWSGRHAHRDHLGPASRRPAGARPRAHPPRPARGGGAGVAKAPAPFGGVGGAGGGGLSRAGAVRAPPLALVLRPTAASVSGALGGLRRLTRSTLSRLPTNRTPGDLFDPAASA